ncbi:hypothetical protein [Carboxylicivirga sp. N1Y90]|uniref:hypothetical protein n=1 Tax=Carboxylicivirga fragile TaxID=3417571 RepID=UPI003D33C4CE|nr:hypothetical protein [Marinilabiliaceae bacterium N1Y90]
MTNYKKVLRVVALVLLILLATLGIGISGGIPVSSSGKKEDTIEVKSELLDNKEESEETVLEVKP